MNDKAPHPDPWVAFSRIGGGVLFYGVLGYVLDLWWGTSFVVGIGIVFGAILGMLTVFLSLNNHDAGQRRFADADRAIKG